MSYAVGRAAIVLLLLLLCCRAVAVGWMVRPLAAPRLCLLSASDGRPCAPRVSGRQLADWMGLKWGATPRASDACCVGATHRVSELCEFQQWHNSVSVVHYTSRLVLSCLRYWCVRHCCPCPAWSVSCVCGLCARAVWAARSTIAVSRSNKMFSSCSVLGMSTRSAACQATRFDCPIHCIRRGD